MSRDDTTPHRYDRAEVRRVLETVGLAEARMRFPESVVMPIARAMGLTAQYRPSDIWRPEWNVLLGTKPDQLLAGELGLAASTVSSQRRKLGIPAITLAERKKAREDRVQIYLQAMSDVDLLRSVAAIRAETRASAAAVKAERKRRGLAETAQYARFHRAPCERLADLRRVCVRAMLQYDPTLTLETLGAVIGLSRGANSSIPRRGPLRIASADRRGLSEGFGTAGSASRDNSLSSSSSVNLISPSGRS